MVGYLQPLAHNFAIVNELGYPTEYFIRWAQQKQIDIGESVDEGRALEIVKTFLTEHPLQAGSGIDLTPDGDLNNSPTISAKAQEILDQIATTQGSVLFRGAAGWEALPPGSSTQYLKSGGPAANPVWQTPSGGGGGGVSWSNGTGERRFLIGASAVGGVGNPALSLGTGPVNSFYWTAGTGTRTLLFNFGSPKVVNGFGVLQDNNTASGTWTLSGSNDNVTFTTLISNFIWGGVPYSTTGFVAGSMYIREFSNASSYQYLRLSLNAGQSTSDRWQQQFFFKCETL